MCWFYRILGIHPRAASSLSTFICPPGKHVSCSLKVDICLDVHWVDFSGPQDVRQSTPDGVERGACIDLLIRSFCSLKKLFQQVGQPFDRRLLEGRIHFSHPLFQSKVFHHPFICGTCNFNVLPSVGVLPACQVVMRRQKVCVFCVVRVVCCGVARGCCHTSPENLSKLNETKIEGIHLSCLMWFT